MIASTIMMTDIAIATSPKSAGDSRRARTINATKSMARVISREAIMTVAPAAVRPLMFCAGGFSDFIVCQGCKRHISRSAEDRLFGLLGALAVGNSRPNSGEQRLRRPDSG